MLSAWAKQKTQTVLTSHIHFIKYTLIGSTGVLLNLIVYTLLVRLTPINYILANFIGVSLGITNNFLLNRKHNFKVLDSPTARYIKFYTVGAIGFVLSSTLLYIFIDHYLLDKVVSKVLTLPAVLTVQYTLNKHVTFRRQDAK